MTGSVTTCLPVAEQSQIGEARRVAQVLATNLGLAETVVGRAGIVATEVATNLVRHAKDGGWVLVQPCSDLRGVEIVAIDRGPGIPNIARCLEDGYSSGGTAGQGLGAIRRQSNTFQIHSETQKGTVLLSTVREKQPAAPSLDVGSVCVSMQGEEVCGDLWSVRHDVQGYTLLVADGLGHGFGAAEAARRAVEIFNESNGYGPADCLDRIHSGLRATRGTAASAHARLAAECPVQGNDQYQVLGTLIHGLEKIASSGLRAASDREAVVADLGTVLDEARIVIEPGLRDAGISLIWEVGEGLPLVQADHHSLLQVFVNLARNSKQALEGCAVREVRISVAVESDLVAVHFRDSGPGVAQPDELFRPFQAGAHSVGLGLYISRAILRAHGGGLRYDPEGPGSCFTVELWPVERIRWKGDASERSEPTGRSAPC